MRRLSLAKAWSRDVALLNPAIAVEDNATSHISPPAEIVPREIESLLMIEYATLIKHIFYVFKFRNLHKILPHPVLRYTILLTRLIVFTGIKENRSKKSRAGLL